MILVFGHSGQVATELSLQGADLCLSRTEADFETPGSLRAAVEKYKPDAVINAVAYTAVDRAEDEPARAFQINGHAVGELAQICAKLQIPLVHISTDYVFDGSGDTPWAVNDATAPLNVYGQSKLAGEDAVRAADGVYAIIRTSWVVSAHGANFVKTMLRLGSDRDEINVVADQIGAPTGARDIAIACLEIARQLQDTPTKTGTYHYQAHPFTSWADVARATFKLAGLKCVVHDIASAQYPTPAARPLNSRMSCHEISRVFNVKLPKWHDKLGEIVMTDI
jgi:dTDP-4-dehydrorhamnose reductase